jgi:hypothetical protein
MVDDLEFYFETINGTLIILLAAALAFLSYYVVDQKRHRGLSWRDCIFDAPPGIGIALPMIGVKLGLLVTRGSRWTWQQFGGGEPMTTWQLHLSLVGTAIASRCSGSFACSRAPTLAIGLGLLRAARRWLIVLMSLDPSN